ncbi:(2Fe-2S)-binding protein [Mucilaginibacter conchicola]|uniref:(2Fe-2S)-binding protein n=1 Tax=Mucilaginibacter conchicola TaxID=2303333 RepID=A0A372NSC3_9SPHI|nr:2Fe-2S iron-sulfur cluster-binding protein [Mucilaginibacter conchicola]RFZ91163.1 (2Fe-2S)-binding protein [Mucilaginibacter conchicola]
MGSMHSEGKIEFKAYDTDGDWRMVETIADVRLSLMDILRSNGFYIKGVCGGLAICGTCLVKVISGAGELAPPDDDEAAMLEMLPDAGTGSRLACQLPLSPAMNGMIFRLQNYA